MSVILWPEGYEILKQSPIQVLDSLWRPVLVDGQVLQDGERIRAWYAETFYGFTFYFKWAVEDGTHIWANMFPDLTDLPIVVEVKAERWHQFEKMFLSGKPCIQGRTSVQIRVPQ